jgi:molecular chaperone HscA
VDVKPSYGLTDEQVEDMLLSALDHGEEDLEARRIAEERVEAQRILQAIDKALQGPDAALLLPGEREQIDAAIGALRAACEGKSASRIHNAAEALDDVSKGWAGRRMDAAIARAIGGKNLGEIEESVAHAQGIEAHLPPEERG